MKKNIIERFQTCLAEADLRARLSRVEIWVAAAQHGAPPDVAVFVAHGLLLLSNRRGLLDLFLARDGHPLFVEVKGEGETVSQVQSEWHKYLAEQVRVSVEICRVGQDAA